MSSRLQEACPNLPALKQHGLVCSLLFPVKLSSCFPLRTGHLRIKTGILFINPGFYRLLGHFKLIDYKGRVKFSLSIWLWQLPHRQCSSEGFVPLFLSTKIIFTISTISFLAKRLTSNGGGKDKLAKTLSEFKCHAPLHRQYANFLVLSLHNIKVYKTMGKQSLANALKQKETHA